MRQTLQVLPYLCKINGDLENKREWIFNRGATFIRDLGQSTAVNQFYIKTSGEKAADPDWQEQIGLFSSTCQFLDFHHCLCYYDNSCHSKRYLEELGTTEATLFFLLRVRVWFVRKC